MTVKTDSTKGRLPDTKSELDVTIPDPTPVIRELHQAVNALDQRLSTFFRYIFGALGIAFLTLFFMVVGIALETWRFNSLQYKTYLREEIEREFAENIVKNQKEFLELVKNLEKELQRLKGLRLNEAQNHLTEKQ